MKTNYIATSLALGALLALAGGCSKTDEQKAASEAKQVMAATSNTVNKAETAAKEVKAKADSAIQSATGNDAQGLIAKAQSLVSDKQYQPALDTLQKLSSYKLTDAQQKMVDDLKAQIQKLMASNPAAAAGGLLGK